MPWTDVVALQKDASGDDEADLLMDAFSALVTRCASLEAENTRRCSSMFTVDNTFECARTQRTLRTYQLDNSESCFSATRRCLSKYAPGQILRRVQAGAHCRGKLSLSSCGCLLIVGVFIRVGF